MRGIKIAGVGSYLPARVVTNDEMAPRIDSSSEWIVSHTGIESRHVAAPEETPSSMGAEAARRALAAAGVEPDDVGLIILATTTPDYVTYPSTSCLVQAQTGCRHAAAFDLGAACSGFVYGLEMAKSYLLCHPEKKVLVVGTEMLSRHTDWSDRSLAMLFGDGAGAAVLAVTDDAPEGRLSETILGADGTGSEFIRREGGARQALCADPVKETVPTMKAPYIAMDGHAVFTFAVRKLDVVLRALCERAKVEPSSLDCIYAHQANLRIIDAVARRMKLPLEKFYLNLQTVGNTSSASIPLCLDRALREGTLKDGQNIALAGFGAGLTWAGMLMTWPYL